MAEIPAALILDAHLKSALSAIRSLGRKGLRICAGSHRTTAMGLHSRYIAESFVYPSPTNDRSGFLKAVSEQANDLGDCVLFAFSDSTLVPLVEHVDCLPDALHCVLPASPASFRTAFDKSETLKLAQTVGVEVPKTFWCEDLGELPDIGRQLGYPVVIKPLRTVSWRGNSGFQATSAFAFSPDDLEAKFQTFMQETGERPMLQQYIEGEETGVEFLAREGVELAACVHRRVRSGSPAGGSGVVTQTVPLDYCGTGARAQKLVSALKWSGPIMVEFKICKKTRVPHLMEINGRFWGSLPLAMAAGVDFPYLYFRLAMGEPIPPQKEYRIGEISRHFLGDCANLRSALFKRDPLRSRAYPSRCAALKGFVFASRSRPAVFDLRDMKPALAEIIDFFGVSVGKNLRPVYSSKPALASRTDCRKRPGESQ